MRETTPENTPSPGRTTMPASTGRDELPQDVGPWPTSSRDFTQSDALRIYERYVDDLLRVIAPRLNPRLRPKVDKEDVLQSAFKSFFCGSFQLADEPALFNLLVTICVRKAIDAANRETAQIRDANREVALNAGEASSPNTARRPQHVKGAYYTSTPADGIVEDDSFVRREFIDRLACGVTPEDKQVVADLLAKLPADLKTICVLRLEGFTLEEIAVKTNRSMRTVQRKLQTIGAVWSDEL